MKARITVVSILLVTLILAITTIGSWSAAQPSATSADVLEARPAVIRPHLRRSRRKRPRLRMISRAVR